jgi:hypothetical protein
MKIGPIVLNVQNVVQAFVHSAVVVPIRPAHGMIQTQEAEEVLAVLILADHAAIAAVDTQIAHHVVKEDPLLHADHAQKAHLQIVHVFQDQPVEQIPVDHAATAAVDTEIVHHVAKEDPLLHVHLDLKVTVDHPLDIENLMDHALRAHLRIVHALQDQQVAQIPADHAAKAVHSVVAMHAHQRDQIDLMQEQAHDRAHVRRLSQARDMAHVQQEARMEDPLVDQPFVGILLDLHAQPIVRALVNLSFTLVANKIATNVN